MTNIENTVEIIQCTSARQFIGKLRASHELWLPDGQREIEWLFRGQADAEWDLLPTGWRTSEEWVQDFRKSVLASIENPIEQAILAKRPGRVASRADVERFEQLAEDNPHLTEILLQSIFEIKLVNNFTKIMNQLGLPIPQSRVARLDRSAFFDWRRMVHQAVDKYKEHVRESGEKRLLPHTPVWYSKNSPIVALARHHGLPLSLVDWTMKPIIAAFFAADDAIDKNPRPSCLSVWAIHANVINDYNEVGKRLKRVDVYRSQLSYLHAQDGVLTYDADGDNFYLKYGRWPTVMDAVQDTEHALSHKPLRKIVLPTEYAGEVLRLLWAEGITLPHLKPSFDIISDTLKKRWHL